MKTILRVFSCILVMMMMMMIMNYPCVRGDFEQDQKECKDQLVSLTSCVSYISGEEKEPSSTCCLNLILKYNQSRKCLCAVVRDRNEPKLGFKVNATLAINLPFRCHIPANETECLDLLKLDPRSPDAQIFEQFSNSTVRGADASSSTSMLEKKRLQFRMVTGISLWLLVSSFLGSF